MEDWQDDVVDIEIDVQEVAHQTWFREFEIDPGSVQYREQTLWGGKKGPKDQLNHRREELTAGVTQNSGRRVGKSFPKIRENA